MKLVDRRMLHSDAFAWYMEKDPILRSTVVGIFRMDRRPDWDRLRPRIDRLSRVIPQLRQKVQSSPTRMGPPWWIADTNFDLDFHLRHMQLAEPGDWSQVLEFTRVAAMKGFDRSRPLWEWTVLDGLADGGTALVAKLHHSMTDGIGAVQLAEIMLDDGPEESDLGPLPDLPDDPENQLLPWLARSALSDATSMAAAGTRLLRSAPANLNDAIWHPLRAAKKAAETTGSVGRFVAPIPHQESTLIGDRRTGRVLMTMDVPFVDLHDAAAAGGGHMNDAYLAALTGGVAKYHEGRGSSLDDMRVTVPINIRSKNDAVAGNRITLVRLKLPAGRCEPMDRIVAINDIMTRSRAEVALDHTQEIAFGLNMLPRPYLSGMFKHIELLASNVPGLRREKWLSGAKLTGYYPFGPTIGAALNVTLMSYDAICNIGINIDTNAIDEPDDMIRCLQESFAEVCSLAPATEEGTS